MAVVVRVVVVVRTVVMVVVVRVVVMVVVVVRTVNLNNHHQPAERTLLGASSACKLVEMLAI